MKVLELTQHPELTMLVEEVSLGEPVEIVEDGRTVVRCVPTARSLCDRLRALQQSFTSPLYAGSEVVDQRRESEP
jgi:antitoxin (DNA-binding transcriptional repressor) of toxin-antitoxin stability system